MISRKVFGLALLAISAVASAPFVAKKTLAAPAAEGQNFADYSTCSATQNANPVGLITCSFTEDAVNPRCTSAEDAPCS